MRGANPPMTTLAGAASRLWRLVLGAAEALFPGYFALVMATGITSIASHLLGFSAIAGALVGVNLLAFAVLSCLTVLRAACFPERLVADLGDHARGPGFFTIVAGTCVVGSQLHGNAMRTAANVSGGRSRNPSLMASQVDPQKMQQAAYATRTGIGRERLSA